MRDSADLRQRQGDLIGGKSDRLGMKITTGNDTVLLYQDQWIIGNSVGFDFQCARSRMQQINGSALPSAPSCIRAGPGPLLNP